MPPYSFSSHPAPRLVLRPVLRRFTTAVPAALALLTLGTLAAAPRAARPVRRRPARQRRRRGQCPSRPPPRQRRRDLSVRLRRIASCRHPRRKSDHQSAIPAQRELCDEWGAQLRQLRDRSERLQLRPRLAQQHVCRQHRGRRRDRAHRRAQFRRRGLSQRRFAQRLRPVDLVHHPLHVHLSLIHI